MTCSNKLVYLAHNYGYHIRLASKKFGYTLRRQLTTTNVQPTHTQRQRATHIEDIRIQTDQMIIIIIIVSLFKEDNIFNARTNLTYGPHKTSLNELQYL